jgi:hypothetical protein
VGGPGAGTAKNQLNSQNDLQNQAFTSQMGTLNDLKGHLSGYLSGNQGFTPQQMATMNSQAINQNAQKYNQAGTSVRNALNARGINGSQTPGGGATAGTLAGLYGAKASDLSNSLNTVQLQNSQQALNNQFNASSILSGNAQTLGGSVGTFGQGANNALSQYVQASNNGFMGNFSRGLGMGLGGAAGAGLTGGLGSALSGLSGAMGGVGSFASLNGNGAASMLPGSFSGGAPSFSGINAPGMSAGGGSMGW